MAKQILPKIEPPADADRISYDEAKKAGLTVIADGVVPKVSAIIPELVPGMWHIEMRNGGLCLGAIADRFSTKKEALQWAEMAYPRTPGPEPYGRYGGYSPSVIYTPTEADLKLLASSPESLDVPCYLVEISPNSRAASGQVRQEQWASKEEALQRVKSFLGSDFTARLRGRMEIEYTRCPEDLRARSAHLKSISGDVAKLADGSIWGIRAPGTDVQTSQHQEPQSWELVLYKNPQQRTFYSEFYSAKRILASATLKQCFRSEQDAAFEGARIMATCKEYVAMSVWHSSAAVACDSILRN